MEDILINANFVYDNEDDSWINGSWVIRLRGLELEAFTKHVDGGLYVKKHKTIDNLESIIDYINNM